MQGIGSGLVFSSLAGVVIASVPPAQTGVASGMNANIRTIGGSIGSAVMAGMVTAQIRCHRPARPSAVTSSASWSSPAGWSLAATAACVMPDIHDQPTHDRFEDADNAGLGMVAGGPALTERHDTPRS